MVFDEMLQDIDTAKVVLEKGLAVGASLSTDNTIKRGILVKNGYNKWYYGNGVIRILANFTEGKPYGKAYGFYENKGIKFIVEYDKLGYMSSIDEYYKDGYLKKRTTLENNQRAYEEIFYKDGRTQCSMEYNAIGELHGTAMWYDRRTQIIRLKLYYKNGVLQNKDVI